ncbi:MAG: endonuclease/exonuclease/phosphatase family protein [Kiritimatiellae bacterium]|nr:endonuclease/exonuclease/phosphatase family protein [Kiritimatiellia bacterium]
MRILTLNLHTWQEPDQPRKFRDVATALLDLRIDVACFQEVGELFANGRPCPDTNASRILLSLLPSSWHSFADWTHIGFSAYREGLAILTPHPILASDSAWISASTDPHDIHARAAIRARVGFPALGPLDVVCTHLSWPSAGFRDQFSRLRDWLGAPSTPPPPLGTLVAGDFNLPAPSPDFDELPSLWPYREQFSLVSPPDPDAPRIDHFWLSSSSPFRPSAPAILFDPASSARVSDHPAYVLSFNLP